MTFHGRRSMRGEPPETDPRFMRAAAQVGRLSPTTSNWGTRCRLSGANVADQRKLLRVESDAQEPWLVSVSTQYVGAIGIASPAGAIARGLFGTGGGTAAVEFDVKPDVAVQLPGGTVDLDVMWAPGFTGVAGGVATPSVQSGALPEFADITSVACQGGISRGRAVRAQEYFASGAMTSAIFLPPFADDFMLLADTASLANLTSVTFMAGATNLVAVHTYTAADLAAIRLNGATIPVPGVATALNVVTAGAFHGYLNYYLSL